MLLCHNGTCQTKLFSMRTPPSGSRLSIPLGTRLNGLFAD